MQYLDPKADLCFKKVFGEHPHLLKSFLNAMLPFDEDRYVESLEYLSPEMVPENPLDKHTIVDVRCRDNYGRQFIVEMQMHWTKSFLQRVLFNASKAYVKQLGASNQFNKLQPVYALSLVNYVFLPDKEDYYHHYQIVNLADTGKQIEGLELIFVELPKFKPESVTEKKLQVLWLRFLTEIDEYTRYAPDELMANTEINEAIEHMRTAAFDDVELYRYEKHWDGVRLQVSIEEDHYEKGREEGLAKGMAEGLAEGKAKGLAEGKAEGKVEGEKLNAYKTALKMISRKMPKEEIAELTELTTDEVWKLSEIFSKYGQAAIGFLDEMKA